jgi:hypothetical protein
VLPAIERCRDARAHDARIQMHVGSDERILMVNAHPTDPGDPAAARCLAAAFRDAGMVSRSGGSGIVTIAAHLPARTSPR